MYETLTPTRTLITRSCETPPLRFMLHDVAVELRIDDQRLCEAMQAWLWMFAVDQWPAGVKPTVMGQVNRYDVDEICRLLPQQPEAIESNGHLELYREPGRPHRIWLIDEQWGIVMLDLLKSMFRAWVVPAATMDDPLAVAESAVMWPMAQLVRSRGPLLMPGISISNDDTEHATGVMLLSPFDLESDLAALLADDWRLLGQRWSAVMESPAGPQLMRMPGWVEHRPPPTHGSLQRMRQPERVDLEVEFHDAVRSIAPLRAVAVIEPCRRMRTTLEPLNPAAGAALLRSAWPLTELTARRAGGGAALLARSCKVARICLGRDPRDLSRQLAGWLGPAALRVAA